VVNLVTLLVNAVCVLVLEVWAVESAAAGAVAAAEALDTAGVRAMVEEVTAPVIVLRGAAVFLQRQPVGAATASHHRTTVAVMILLMLKGNQDSVKILLICFFFMVPYKLLYPILIHDCLYAVMVVPGIDAAGARPEAFATCMLLKRTYHLPSLLGILRPDVNFLTSVKVFNLSILNACFWFCH
jgi:hypothetical protein